MIAAAACWIAVAAQHNSNRDETSDACTEGWHGYIDASVNVYELSVTLRRTDGNLCIGTLNIPEQSLIDVPLRNVALSDESIGFSTSSRNLELEFLGTLSEGKQRIDGQLRRGSAGLPFKLVRGTAALAYRD